MSINVEHLISELRDNSIKKDLIKARLVLSHLNQVDTNIQKKILFELIRSEPEFKIPLLAFIVETHPSVSQSLPVIKETLLSTLIDYPTILLRYLQQPELAGKQILINMAGELRLEESVPVLMKILAEAHEPSLLKSVLSALSMIADPVATNAVTDFLYAANRDLIIAAILALGQIGTPTAMQRLAERMGTDNELDTLILDIFTQVQDSTALDKLNQTMRSHHAYLRNYAKTKLTDIGLKAVPLLCQNLLYDDPDLQIHSLNVLGLIGDESAVVAIRKLLYNEPKDANVRFAAYESLGTLPMRKGAYVLATGLTDKVEHVRMAAAKTIDANFNEVLAAGIKNMVRAEDGDANEVVKIIIFAQADNIFMSLAKEEVFQRQALACFKKAHNDLRLHYNDLLRRRGLHEFAAQILPELDKKYEKKRVCAVDDSRMILSIYKNTLHELGFEPFLFEFPESAIKWILSEKPDLVLTDLNMPDINGIELARAIRKEIGKEQLPIIMITTQNDIQDNKSAYEAGVDAIAHKPFTAESLGETIKQYI